MDYSTPDVLRRFRVLSRHFKLLADARMPSHLMMFVEDDEPKVTNECGELGLYPFTGWEQHRRWQRGRLGEARILDIYQYSWALKNAVYRCLPVLEYVTTYEGATIPPTRTAIHWAGDLRVMGDTERVVLYATPHLQSSVFKGLGRAHIGEVVIIFIGSPLLGIADFYNELPRGLWRVNFDKITIVNMDDDVELSVTEMMYESRWRRGRSDSRPPRRTFEWQFLSTEAYASTLSKEERKMILPYADLV